MAYTKTTWVNGQEPAINADNLNKIENGIESIDVGKLNISDKATEAEALAGTDDTKWMTPLKTANATGYKIGDIKTTARTDLGSKWLLCNGAIIDENTYPDLDALFSNRPLRYFNKISNIQVRLSSIAYGNGYWVAAGYTDSGGYPCIFYTTDINSGSWTFNQLDSSVANTPVVAYGNGYWVVGFTNNNVPNIFYATTPNGTWTKKTINPDSCSVQSIIYANSTWVISGVNSSNYPCVFYTSTPSSSWTLYQMSINTSQTTKVGYGNGYWCVAVTFTTNQLYIYYGVTISNLTQRNIDSSYYVKSIDYGNGYWAISCTSSTNSYPVIFYAASVPSNTWNAYTISTTGVNNIFIKYNGSIWLFATDNSSTLTTYSTASVNNAPNKLNYYSVSPISSLFSMSYGDNQFVIPGIDVSVMPYVIFSPKTVPSISFDNSYAYIKALN